MSKSSETWLQELKAIECTDATYPAKHPALVFERAEGSRIWDVSGNEYIDLCAGFGALPLGHNHKKIRELLTAYATDPRPPIIHGMGDVYPSRTKIELITLLQNTLSAEAPHLKRISLAISGSQAVETALKTAFLRTKKFGVICFENGYHGVDLGILPVTAREDFRTDFRPWLTENHVKRLPYGCGADALQKAVEELNAAGGVAAILVEPIQGRAGARFAGTAWLKSLKDTAHKAGALLIFDEVFVGLGRAGKLTFAADVACDLTCLGKALGGGMPISAVAGTEDAMGAWPESQGEAIHTGTFFGHPLSCAVAETTLKVITEEKLVQRAQRVGETTLGYLKAGLGKNPRVKEVRGHGLMMAVEFDRPGFGAKLMDHARGSGLIVLASGSVGECVSLTPALNISESLLFESIGILTKSVESLGVLS